MKTNFQMLQELLEKYNAKQRGFISKEEKELIINTLHIEEMDLLALNNLRDFVVIFMTRDEENIDYWDKMSAITNVIDNYIFVKGGNL